VNLYFWVNGCSPEGRYARNVRTGGGIEVPAASIVKITGVLEGEIRQFLRARMQSSYEALRFSRATRADAAMCDKAEGLGVPRDKAFLLADWLRNCEFMTPEEAGIHAALAERQIAKANRRRRDVTHSTRVDDVADTEATPVTGNFGHVVPGGSYSY